MNSESPPAEVTALTDVTVLAIGLTADHQACDDVFADQLDIDLGVPGPRRDCHDRILAA